MCDNDSATTPLSLARIAPGIAAAGVDVSPAHHLGDRVAGRGAEGSADLLVVGRIATGDPAAPTAEAMAISGGRIIGLGSAADLDGLTGPATQTVAPDAALCAGFVFNAGGAVGFLQLSNLWQYVLGLAPSSVAIWQLPVSVTSIVGAIVLGRLMTRGMTAQRSLLLGGLLTAAGSTLAFFVRDATTPLAFVPAGILVALGLTAAALPYGTLVLGEAPAEFYGPVTSSRTTFGQLFYSLGTAVSTVVVTQVTIAGITSRLHATGMTDAAVSSALASVGTYAKDGVRPDAAVFDIATAAYRDGFGAVMIGMAVIALVASIVGALLIRRAARHA